MIAGLRSLRSRIFVASTLLATASIGAAVYLVSARLTAEAEAELQRELTEAARLVDEQSENLFETFTRTATLIADQPKFKAAIDLRDVPTIQPIARDYLEQAGADLVVVTDRSGRQLAAASAANRFVDLPERPPEIEQSLAGHATTAFWPHPTGILQVATVPVTIDRERPEVLGTLAMGYLLDAERVTRLKELAGADLVFVQLGRVRASSFAPEMLPADGPWAAPEGRIPAVDIGGEEYTAIVRPLPSPGPGADLRAAPRAVVLRSRTARMSTLDSIRTTLLGIALATVALAAVLSYGVARTVTSPLATITAHMRQVAATGDLTRKLDLRDTVLNDEDALLVARTFNALTDSVAASQRDAAQRERLSALGRLSTVIAHEVRNPLMIIKGALRQLARTDGSADDRRDAAQDINGEVDRLNRVVNEVLDFSRPVRFECAPASVNDLCRSARDAVLAAAATPAVELDLAPDSGEIVTDAERIRTVLVNLLTNARSAVDGQPETTGPLVTLRAARLSPTRVAITVADRGVGIARDDLGRVFDPYFTTRRTGNGLGLAIAKNLVEGLGGAIAVVSEVGVGTQMRVELADAPARQA